MNTSEIINKFLNSEIKISVETSKAHILTGFIYKITGGNFHIKTVRDGKYTHFSKTEIPFVLFNNSRLRDIKKLEKEFDKEQLLTRKEQLILELSNIERELTE
jgi:hypothetical protein